LKRLAYLILGLLATALAIEVVVTQHSSWWPLVVLAIAPDLALLFGAARGLERGQIHPRAVPLYNAVHRLWAPAILVVLMVLLQSPGWLAGGLAWIAHIAFDRSLGFGLRSPEGFQHA
jgi:hypothetical protein